MSQLRSRRPLLRRFSARRIAIAGVATALLLQLGIAATVPVAATAASGERIASEKHVDGRTLSLVINDATGEIRAQVTGAQSGDHAWLDSSLNGFTSHTGLINYTGTVTDGIIRTTASFDESTDGYLLFRACMDGQGVSATCTADDEAGRTQLGDVLAATDGLEAYWNDTSKIYDEDPLAQSHSVHWLKWWHSAVATSALAATVKATGDTSYLAQLDTIFEENKDKDEDGLGDTFRNKFIDDTGWWAMAWIDTYRLTGDQKYLDAAVVAAQFMADHPATCGGIYWHVDTTYHAAISNSLYLQVASALANEITDPAQKALWKGRAEAQWAWYSDSGIITPQGRVVDGMGAEHCTAGGGVYTYNQGVMLSALVEYFHATDDASVLGRARTIADRFTTTDNLNTTAHLGVMRDSCEPGDGAGDGMFGYPCKNDGPTFKGPAVRGLAELNAELADKPYAEYLDVQRASALEFARNASKAPGTDQYGLRWYDSGADKQHIGNQVAAVMLMAYTYQAPDVPLGPLVAPTITLSPAAPNAAGWYASSVTASITATLPAGARIEYSLDTGTWHTYTSPFTITDDATGAHIYARVFSPAHSPQNSDIKTVTLNIDRVAPTATAAFDEDERTVSLAAADDRSGIARTEYRVGNDAWAPYTAPFPTGDESTLVTYRTWDVAGNSSTQNTLAIPKKRADGTLITSDVTVALAPAIVAYGASAQAIVTITTDELTVQPTGRVEIRLGTGVIGSATVTDGKATIALPRTLRPGNHALTATYLGDAVTYSASTGFVLRVTKAGATVKVKAPKKIKRTKRAKVKVTVTATTGVAVTGKIKVVVRKGKKKVVTRTVKLNKKGAKSIKLKRLKRGKHKIKVTYRGSSTLTKKVASVKKLTVRK